jgi:hypothetical protein
VADNRLPQAVAAVGTAGCALTLLALVGRWPSLLPVGLAGVGASYGLFLSLRSGPVDSRAPVVAAALFVAAEFASWSLEPTAARSRRIVVARRLVSVGAGGVATALVGGLLLVLTSGVSGGVALEGAGVVAAALTVAAIALLASRRSV